MARGAVPPHFVGENSVYYLCINRNKRTVAVQIPTAQTMPSRFAEPLSGRVISVLFAGD